MVAALASRSAYWGWLAASGQIGARGMSTPAQTLPSPHLPTGAPRILVAARVDESKEAVARVAGLVLVWMLVSIFPLQTPGSTYLLSPVGPLSPHPPAEEWAALEGRLRGAHPRGLVARLPTVAVLEGVVTMDAPHKHPRSRQARLSLKISRMVPGAGRLSLTLAWRPSSKALSPSPTAEW